jgi:hypothetical protein
MCHSVVAVVVVVAAVIKSKPGGKIKEYDTMKFRIVFWDVLPCKIIVNLSSLMMEAARTSETSVDNYLTRQYSPEDNSELHTHRCENLKSHRV